MECNILLKPISTLLCTRITRKVTIDALASAAFAPSAEERRMSGRNELSCNTYTPYTKISNAGFHFERGWNEGQTHPMIRPEVIYLFIPHCDPHFLADKLDSIERVGEPRSVFDQPIPHEIDPPRQPLRMS